MLIKPINSNAPPAHAIFQRAEEAIAAKQMKIAFYWLKNAPIIRSFVMGKAGVRAIGIVRQMKNATLPSVIAKMLIPPLVFQFAQEMKNAKSTAFAWGKTTSLYVRMLPVRLFKTALDPCKYWALT